MDHILVMGIAGAGKSTIAAALAERLGARYVDGDDFHTALARAKMAAGQSLTDADREPWLRSLRAELDASPQRIVLACSALTPAYRAQLGAPICIFLDIERDVALARLAQRPNHFAGPALLQSQWETLVPPMLEEGFSLLRVAADLPLSVQLDTAGVWLTQVTAREL